MTAVVAIGLLAGFAGILLALLLRRQYIAGRSDARLEDGGERDAAVDAANTIRDRLVRDADFASRVRRRFSR